MPHTKEEQANLDAVEHALREAADDFRKLSQVFAEDIQWTIVVYGPVARTFNGIKDLLDNGETALASRRVWTTS